MRKKISFIQNIAQNTALKRERSLGSNHAWARNIETMYKSAVRFNITE